MVKVPTEKRYEEHIERELNSLLDDGLQFHSKVHQRDDSWYDKNLCVVGDEFIEFLKETQKETYEHHYICNPLRFRYPFLHLIAV